MLPIKSTISWAMFWQVSNCLALISVVLSCFCISADIYHLLSGIIIAIVIPWSWDRLQRYRQILEWFYHRLSLLLWEPSLSYCLSYSSSLWLTKIDEIILCKVVNIQLFRSCWNLSFFWYFCVSMSTRVSAVFWVVWRKQNGDCYSKLLLILMTFYISVIIIPTLILSH